MPLEDLIRTAIAERRLVAINLWPAPGGWQGNSSADRVAWHIGLDTDPVAALRKALGDQPALSVEDMLE